MKLYGLFFRLDHRIGRAKFWLGFIVLEAIYIAGDWTLGEWLHGLNPYDLGVTVEPLSDHYSHWAVVGLGTILLYPQFAVLLKRCHDRNKSFLWLLPWLIWDVSLSILESARLAFVTLEPSSLDWILMIFGASVFIWIIVDLGILPGTRGTNRFGPDPRENGSSGS